MSRETDDYVYERVLLWDTCPCTDLCVCMYVRACVYTCRVTKDVSTCSLVCECRGSMCGV